MPRTPRERKTSPRDIWTDIDKNVPPDGWRLNRLTRDPATDSPDSQDSQNAP